MSAWIDDLTPYFSDPCKMSALLAREAGSAVIIRRGPSKRWHIISWATGLDAFEKGQWFHGSFYPEKCDLSPDGKLFVYFAGKHHASNPGGYGDMWTAVSRPPYLTALALWPSRSGTWLGGGVFVDEQTLKVWSEEPHHPDHPPGPLKITYPDPHPIPKPPYLHLWEQHERTWRKEGGGMILEYPRGGYDRKTYKVFNVTGPSISLNPGSLVGEVPLSSFEAHWADFDQHGRLVATVGGRVFEGKITTQLQWRQLVDFSAEKPERMEAPEWAKHW